MNQHTHRTTSRSIVILGAGYAGVIAANRLLSALNEAERADTRVRLVNPRARFVQRIRLHELVAGSTPDVTLSLTEMLHPAAEIVLGTAELIDAERNIVVVTTATGSTEIGYDELIYAIGSGSAAEAPGAREHALCVADPELAITAAATVAKLPAGAHLSVVGGGLTGVETAAEIAETRSDIRVSLIAGTTLLPGFSDRGRSRAQRTLARLGVEIIERRRVRSVQQHELVFETGQPLPFDACVWAAGFSVPAIAAQSGLAVDRVGRLRVHEDLTSLSATNIVGAGDAIKLPTTTGAHVRMGCAAALPLGEHAAATVLHHLRGVATTPASVAFVVQCLSLGRKRGVIQFVTSDDRPKRFVLSGRTAAFFKEIICKFTVSEARKTPKSKEPRGTVTTDQEQS